MTLRLAFRIKILRRLRLDDYLVIASFVFCLASTLVWAVLARNLYVAIESSVNPDLATILDLINKSATGLHAILASYLLTWTSIWLIKISFMVFFYGLGRQVQSQRHLWWGVFVYVIAAYCVAIGTMDYNCLTSNGLDMISKCRSKATLDYEYITVRVQMAMDITTDIFSKSLPKLPCPFAHVTNMFALTTQSCWFRATSSGVYPSTGKKSSYFHVFAALLSLWLSWPWCVCW